MDRGGHSQKMSYLSEYSVTCGHTSVAGDMSVSRKEHGSEPVNQGGTAEIILDLPSLTE